MTKRGLKNINVFYSTFTNVFLFLSRFLRFLTFFYFFFWNVFFTSMVQIDLDVRLCRGLQLQLLCHFFIYYPFYSVVLVIHATLHLPLYVGLFGCSVRSGENRRLCDRQC